MVITISISEDQVKRAEALARQRRMQTGEDVSRSSEIGRAIDTLFLAECLTDKTEEALESQPAKEITTLFETIGRRRKLIGFEAKYNGEVIGTFNTRDEAQAELDRIAYELTQTAA